MAGNRTPLYVRKQAGGMLTIENVPAHPGNIWWVDSGSSDALDTAGYGLNPDAPFATLDYAVGACTANNGDVIYLLPGHSETYATTGAKVTLDLAGVRVIGLGDGSDRPTFTFSNVGATWTWSAANVSIENLLFVTAIDSVVTFATISGNDAKIVGCETRDTTDKEVLNDFTCTGDRLTVDGLFKNGFTGGNANVAVLTMAGVDRAEVKNCRFMTKVTTGVINFTASSTLVEVHDCDFLVTSTTDLSKNVVVTAGTNTYSVYNCFDLGAGASFSGGSGGALAVDDLGAVAAALVVVDGYFDAPTANAATDTTIRDAIGRKTDTANTGAVAATKSLMAYAKQAVTNTEAAALIDAMQEQFVVNAAGIASAATDALFTVAGGPILVTALVGIVTDTIGANVATCTISATATSPGATPVALSTAVAITDDAIGTSYTFTAADPAVLVPITGGAAACPPLSWLVPAGALNALFSANNTGTIAWYMRYKPLKTGITVVAA